MSQSRSPFRQDRDQIEHIIDDITSQIDCIKKQKFSEMQNMWRSQHPGQQCGPNSKAQKAGGGLHSARGHPQSSRSHVMQSCRFDKSCTGSVKRHLPRDYLVEQSCCDSQAAGSCTHYHNHYEGAQLSDNLIQQCFDRIGQSLDQLANKDRIIQRLISDNYQSNSKKQYLRSKLKYLKTALCSS